MPNADAIVYPPESRKRILLGSVIIAVAGMAFGFLFPHLPAGLIILVKNFINKITNPPIMLSIASVLFLVVLWKIEIMSRPLVFVGALVVMIVFFILSFHDPNFHIIMVAPDNFPIIMMLFLIVYFLWLSFYKAVNNDQRMAKGLPTFEQTESGEKILTWPDLVYSEFLCAVFIFVALIFWSVYLKAPLEQPANPASTPNPSKAPWYFLGLQEMLVYYDPWIAGVVLPTLIIVGLMVLPYIDMNPRGNGYYTFRERKFAISVYLFGFMILWILLIILGTFLRGPGWYFFGPYDFWNKHKVEPLNNVNLSEYFWVYALKSSLPPNLLVRESPGFALVFLYLVALPPLLTKTVFKKFVRQMGAPRYYIMVMLLLIMASLPIKMLLRWTINLKYIVAVPEWFFNI